MKPDISVTDIELALTRMGPLDKRRYLVVPNVYWGWDLSYEADLIAVRTDSLQVTEVEIKVSVSDFRNDRKKRKFENGFGLDRRIQRFFYAVPAAISAKVEPELPPGAGLFIISREEYGVTVEIRRRAQRLTTARPSTPEEMLKLHQLAAMRYWDLVQTLNAYHRDCQPKPEEVRP